MYTRRMVLKKKEYRRKLYHKGFKSHHRYDKTVIEQKKKKDKTTKTLHILDKNSLH